MLYLVVTALGLDIARDMLIALVDFKSADNICYVLQISARISAGGQGKG